MTKVTLILGGARSGKSRYAEELALSRGLSPVYVATAQALDDEISSRIAQHKARRLGRGWREIEAPLDLSDAIRTEATARQVLLVDCLTLWLTNLMVAGRDITAESGMLLECLAKAEGEIILVSNEVGLGIVPENAMARTFRDHAGHLHQDIATEANTVLLIVAGLPVVIKSET